jgi:DNA-binding CsgD family transcriptional regulator
MNARMLDRLSGRPASPAFSPVDQLTDRELEVLDLIGRGKASSDIANLLHMSIKTVETHRSHIRQKLQVQSRSELIQFAVRWVEGESRP